jgi:phosphoribosyl 1,2-cyclic phosphate phosphodiesterase
MYGFLVEEADKRALIAPDDLLGWERSAEVQGVDVAVVPMGVVEFDPFTGERRIPAEHPVLGTEATAPEDVGARAASGRLACRDDAH